jgi:antirestriction protein ArdC
MSPGLARRHGVNPPTTLTDRTPMTDTAEQSALRVTVEDLKTGDVQTAYVPLHDYVIIATGDCHYSVQAYPRTGTHQITVKGRKPSRGAA